MTETAAAHIITADAEALGDPEILIMTRDEGMGAELIERIGLPLDASPAAVLAQHRWITSAINTEVQTGYFIVNVERA
jgi:hypothetical protein